MIGDAAGHDAGIVAELGIDIDRDAVEGDPVADAHADRGDLVFTWAAIRQFGLVRPHHPDTDPARAALGGDVEAGQGTDRPFLEVVDVAPHVLPPGPQVEHDVGHALAGPVIGVLAAAARDMDRKAHRLEQVLGPGTGARGVERRVFQQPHQFPRAAGTNVGDPRLHRGQGLLVGHETLGNAPFGAITVHCGKIVRSGPRCNGLACPFGGYLVSPAAS